MQATTINTNNSEADWHEILMRLPRNNDFLFFYENVNAAIWFITNYVQFLTRSGGHEITSLYGGHINSLADFIYQANYSLPVSYRLRILTHALYDLLLNFETEPPNRFLFWNDAQVLYSSNRTDFEAIFEMMISAAYCNRNGVSTIREDGHRYQVNQRNFFFFHGLKPAGLKELTSQVRYIPSIDGSFYKILEFNIIQIRGTNGVWLAED
jgi:hypothetical protein